MNTKLLILARNFFLLALVLAVGGLVAGDHSTVLYAVLDYGWWFCVMLGIVLTVCAYKKKKAKD